MPGQLQEIRNCQGKLLCMVDPVTGYLEAKIRDTYIRMELPVGAKVSIETGNIYSDVCRISESRFSANSFPTL